LKKFPVCKKTKNNKKPDKGNLAGTTHGPGLELPAPSLISLVKPAGFTPEELIITGYRIVEQSGRGMSYRNNS
jgi:hypothetical protein